MTDWEKYNHQYLWLMVMRADPQGLMNRAYDLSGHAATMNRTVEDIQSRLQSLFSSWGGEAAQTAADKINPVLEWAYDSATKASDVANRLGEYARAINTARITMPPPTDNGQVDAVHSGGSAEIGDPTMNYFELKAIVNRQTATPTQAEASKDKAIQVVRVYEKASHTASKNMPTFTRPPGIGPFPPMPPSPEPQHRPDFPVTHPGSSSQPSAARQSVGATTLSSYVGPPSGTGAFGAPGGSGILGGLGSTGGMPGAIGSGPGMSPVSGVGLLPNNPVAEEGQLDPLVAEQAAAAEEAGWPGCMPMGAGGRSNRDGEHRDRFSPHPDLIGELPPTYPPVLGL